MLLENYNLNVTKVLDSDFKNAFLGIFNLTVGILIPGRVQLLVQFRICHVTTSPMSGAKIGAPRTRVPRTGQILRFCTYYLCYIDFLGFCSLLIDFELELD